MQRGISAYNKGLEHAYQWLKKRPTSQLSYRQKREIPGWVICH
jgi:hypothetical protein